MIFPGIAEWVAFIVSFLITLISMPFLIIYLRKKNWVVKDQNKKEKPLVPLSGGISAAGGVLLALISYLFLKAVIYQDSSLTLNLLVASLVILLVTLVGWKDDSVIGKDKNASKGLNQWQKPLLTLIASIPLIFMSWSNTILSFPFIGDIHLGILYPLLLVPIVVMIASNMVNLYAGFNGLEAGLGLAYFGMLGLYASYHGIIIVALLAWVTFAALLAFMRFNWVPAKILPGDSLTYLLGGVLACIAILGNMKTEVGIIAIPFAIEFFLKARSRFKAKTYGEWKNGKIISLHGQEVYSIPHLMTRTGKFTEKQIVISLIILQVLVSSLIWVI